MLRCYDLLQQFLLQFVQKDRFSSLFFDQQDPPYPLLPYLTLLNFTLLPPGYEYGGAEAEDDVGADERGHYFHDPFVGFYVFANEPLLLTHQRLR